MSRVKANELCSSKTQKKASSYQFGKFVLKGLRNGLYLKRNYFIEFRASWSSIFQNINITITATNIREKHKGFQVFDCKIREIEKFNFINWEKKKIAEYRRETSIVLPNFLHCLSYFWSNKLQSVVQGLPAMCKIARVDFFS